MFLKCVPKIKLDPPKQNLKNVFFLRPQNCIYIFMEEKLKPLLSLNFMNNLCTSLVLQASPEFTHSQHFLAQDVISRFGINFYLLKY